MQPNVCRTCGKHTTIEKSLNLFENSNQTTLKHIELIIGASLQNCITWPNLLCMPCQTRVKLANSFRERCLEVQKELFESLYAEDISFPQESARKNSELEEHLEESQISIEIERIEGESSETACLEFEDILSDSEICEETNNNDDVVYDDVNYLIYESDEDVNEKSNLKTNPAKQKTGRKRRKLCQTNGTFFCEECGNHIKGHIAFILHCKRHRGVKEFHCEFCEDRFCTPAELKRHVRRHTGEKPFKCRYCPRSFSDSSTRLKHERTHTNERPFACTECKSAFTTAYILKNHMLVHTGEKAFKCDLCDKSFSRDTHLTTHFRSNAHKRNMVKEGSSKYKDSELFI
ncbi:transcription factor Ouib [Drosophila eugracilis]|uniref:transcription factor Ouib n=1 Tax=Drosophila eugracilis TaxID=29029 RepID=UPI001BDB4B88|nr:transcription factor Ouib [Drosophila eugracilis]